MAPRAPSPPRVVALALAAATVTALGVLAPWRVFADANAPAPAPLERFRGGRRIDGRCAQRPCIALTFDDGPDDVTTPQVLAELARHGVHATFFVVGHRIAGGSEVAVRNRAVLAETRRRGHTIGNHSYDHASFDDLDDAGAALELDRTTRLIRAVLGERTYLFRPPFGAFHAAPGVHATYSRGLTPVLWEIDSRDWAVRTPEQVVANFGAALDASPDGGVVLFHDTLPRTVAALPGVFAEIAARNEARRARGEAPYAFISLDELWRPLHAPRAPAAPASTAPP